VSLKLQVIILSVVIPIHNEEPSVLALYDCLTSVLESLAQAYEIIFVDDASTDRSFALLANLLETDSRLKVVRLRRNFGQTAALSAGQPECILIGQFRRPRTGLLLWRFVGNPALAGDKSGCCRRLVLASCSGFWLV